MKFAYFINRIEFDAQGRGSAVIAVRPLTAPEMDAPFKIRLTVPLNVSVSAPTCEAALTAALQAAARLLPEANLAAWVAAHPGQCWEQPAHPLGALAAWQAAVQWPPG